MIGFLSKIYLFYLPTYLIFHIFVLYNIINTIRDVYKGEKG